MSDHQTGKLIPTVTEMFRFQAWVAMGKVANPVSGSVNRDLGVAKECIDLLAELETRTEGRRSEDETKLLRGALTELRINFVDEMARPVEAPSEEAKEADAPAGGDSSGSEEESETGEGRE